MSLTHQLKLASIPVAVVAEEGEEEVEGVEPAPRAVITFIPSTATVRSGEMYLDWMGNTSLAIE